MLRGVAILSHVVAEKKQCKQKQFELDDQQVTVFPYLHKYWYILARSCCSCSTSPRYVLCSSSTLCMYCFFISLQILKAFPKPPYVAALHDKYVPQQ